MSNQNVPALLAKGGFPNSLVRSALFCTRSLGAERAFMRSASVFAQTGYSISYTGEELNQYDSQVLQAVFALQKQSGLHLGAAVDVKQADVVRMIGKKPGGTAFEFVFASLTRLCEATIRIDHAGPSKRVYVGHIVDRFQKDDAGHLSFTLNPELTVLFDSDCTFLSLSCKLKVSRLISKWLLDFSSSHANFMPLTVDYLMKVSGYAGEKKEFCRQLSLACGEIVETLGHDAPFVDWELSSGRLSLYKKQRGRQVEQAGKTVAPQMAAADSDGFEDPFAKLRR